MRRDTRARGVLGMYKREGPVGVELYEGMLMLQVGLLGLGCSSASARTVLCHAATSYMAYILNVGPSAGG